MTQNFEVYPPWGDFRLIRLTYLNYYLNIDKKNYRAGVGIGQPVGNGNWLIG